MYSHIFRKSKKRNIFFHYCAIAGIAFLFYVLTENASAATTPAEPAGQWQFKVARGENKAFHYCQAKMPYSNHLSLVFAQDLSNTLNMAIEMPQKVEGFQPTNMVLKFDNIYNHQSQAFIENDQLMVMPLIQHFNLFKIISKSKILEIKGPTDTIAFDLKGTAAAVKKLRECVMLQRLPKEKKTAIKKIKPVSVSKPKPVKASAPKPAPKPKAVDILPASIRPIFDNARLTGGRPNIQKQVSDANANQYHWDVMGVHLSVAEQALPPNNVNIFIDGEIASHVDRLQSSCGPDGISFLGPIQKKQSGITYRSSSFVCDLPKDAWYESVVYFYDPKASSIYQMSYKGTRKNIKKD